MEHLEPLIAQWRSYVSRASAVNGHDAEELEAHLRDQITGLRAVGLAEDEAFLVAVKRLGEVDEISREFALEHSGRLWRQFVVPGEAEPGFRAVRFLPALILSLLAAIAIQVPRLAGLGPQSLMSFYLRNASLLVLPFLAWYFARRHRLTKKQVVVTAAPFLVAALTVNLYPWTAESSSEVLVGLHLPVVLWFAVAFLYMGATWRIHERRMDFVRFTGEWFIYYVLIALGGGVLLMFTAVILEPAGPEVVQSVFEWALPSGMAGAVLIAAWLVEEKQSVVENMAPVLTLIFTPLFALMLAGSAVTYAVAGLGSQFDREAIFILDILLIVVLGLLLYRMSARESTEQPALMDRIQLVAAVSALALDLMVVSSMITRISELGFTPNRAAALGLNLVLLMNLVWASWLAARFISRAIPFQRLERWQTTYLPVYGWWTATVVLVLPPLFSWA